MRSRSCPRDATPCVLPQGGVYVLCPIEVSPCDMPPGGVPCVVPQGGMTLCHAPGKRRHVYCPREVPTQPQGGVTVSAAPRVLWFSTCSILQASPWTVTRRLSAECTDSRSPWTRPRHRAMRRIQGRSCGLHDTSPGSGRGSLLPPHLTHTLRLHALSQRNGRGSLCVSVCVLSLSCCFWPPTPQGIGNGTLGPAPWPPSGACPSL